MNLNHKPSNKHHLPSQFTLVLVTLTLILFDKIGPCQAGIGVLCSLTWVNMNSGDDLPPAAVDSGNGDFVARAKIDTTMYQPGRYDLTSNTTYVGYAGVERPFTNFDLLTNPANCILTWITFNPTEPIIHNKHAVDPAQPTVFMGRGLYKELVVGGRVENDILFIGIDGGEQTIGANYEILTSAYQLVDVKLTHFRFSVGDPTDIETKTIKRLFGIEEIVNDISNTTIRQTVVHSDIFEDEFLISEELGGSTSWRGVGGVTLNLKLWYGSPIITDSFDASDEKSDIAVLRRTREISMAREFEISSETGVQICSVSVLLVGYPIQFTATMEIDVAGNGLSESEILHIVQDTGRPLVGSDGQVVKATFSGKLDGEYLLRTTSFSMNIDEEGACSSKYK